MATESERPAARGDEEDERKPLGWKVIAACAVLLVLFGVILFGGVRGCTTETAEEAAARAEKAKKEEKEKEKKQLQQEDPRILFPVVLPNEGAIGEQLVKPGHWASALQQMQARERDFFGRTRTEVVDGNHSSMSIEHTPFMLESIRPKVALPKGTTKFVESTFFVPHLLPQSGEKEYLSTQFEEGGLGYELKRMATLRSMLPHQYHIVVLAKEPDRYAAVKSLDSVQSPFSGEPDSNDRMVNNDTHYYVELMQIDRTVPLPENPLLWTSIAYLLWDEVDPEPFSPEQEQAMVDWLHWGGQLIVSGPDSLDLIRGSFLAPFMPANSGGPREIATSDLRTLSENWMISAPKRKGQRLAPVAPWSGVTLVPTEGADKTIFESTGGMLIERRVGRGRIVVSAMQLMEREFVNWASGFPSLFNACLLRRPPRQYHQVDVDLASLVWDTSTDSSLKERRLDARLNTAVRYFSRDVGVESHYRWVSRLDGQAVPPGRRATGNLGTLTDSGIREWHPPPNAGGLGAWNDFNDTAKAARTVLHDAAGVDVPDRMFVIGCLAAYLFVLVPVNYIIFRMLGRIEWAWIAAPIIAIVSTYVVVQRAQLDIGFVRSQTEINLLELQPDHSRAHLARFTALYTSLSTTYDLAFDDTTALAMPFPRQLDDRHLGGQGRTTINFERQAEGVRMSGLPVLSNSTSFVHSEQMVTLDGPVRIGRSSATGGWQIENKSKLQLRSAGIVRHSGKALHGTWIGELAPGQSTSIGDPSRFPPLPDPAAPFNIERTAEARMAAGPRLNLEPLVQLAYDVKNMDVGEIRLVARVDEPIAGETVSPAASQLRSSTLVVAHLGYGPLLLPRPDVNTRQDVKMQSSDIVEE